jgi:hypothetical protein
MKYRNNDGEIDHSLFCIFNGKNKREGVRVRVYLLNSATDKMR